MRALEAHWEPGKVIAYKIRDVRERLTLSLVHFIIFSPLDPGVKTFSQPVLLRTLEEVCNESLSCQGPYRSGAPYVLLAAETLVDDPNGHPAADVWNDPNPRSKLGDRPVYLYIVLTYGTVRKAINDWPRLNIQNRNDALLPLHRL